MSWIAPWPRLEACRRRVRAIVRVPGRSVVVDPSGGTCATKTMPMTLAPDRLHRQRFATPRENQAVLAVPPMEEAGDLARENVRLRSTADYSLQGRSLAELSRQARAELLGAAQNLDRCLSRGRTGEPRSAGLDFSRRASAGAVSSRGVVQELRLGRGWPVGTARRP